MMFGSRLLVNMACKTIFRPSFKIAPSFSSMAPIYTQTTSLLGKINNLPTNLLVRNLRQMILKAEQDLQLESELTCTGQLSLLVQVKQTGLIKQSRTIQIKDEVQKQIFY